MVENETRSEVSSKSLVLFLSLRSQNGTHILDAELPAMIVAVRKVPRLFSKVFFCVCVALSQRVRSEPKGNTRHISQ